MAIAWTVSSSAQDSSDAQAMRPLAYNQPGLVVDLGVGLWAWPIPCDADGDGDYDLLVSCPDKPSNGVWWFENSDGDTRVDALPIFLPARRLSGTVHYVMPSYVDGHLRVLSPGREYEDFERFGTERFRELPIAPDFYQATGPQSKGPGVRHNQWRYADYDGDSLLDLIVGIEDWSYYGWDDAYDATGTWIAGPLKGRVFWFRGDGRGGYASPQGLEIDGQILETYGCPSPNFDDFDGDGDLDLLCGEFLDGFTYFQNLGTRSAPRYTKGIRLADAAGEPIRMDLQMIVPVAFDWNRDGHSDLIVGDEDGRVAWLQHTGAIAENGLPIFEHPRYFQQRADSLKCGALATPVAVDWDGDGDQDILSGNTAGRIEFFENTSGPNVPYPSWNAPQRLHAGGTEFRIMAGPNGSIQGPAEAKWGYTTLSADDWDLDGRIDLVVNSILGEVIWLRNVGSPQRPILESPRPIEVQWEDTPQELPWGWRRAQGRSLLTQWRTTPVVRDFNRDGLPDLAMLDTEGYLAFWERKSKNGTLVLSPPRRIFLDEQGQPMRLTSRRAGGSGRRKLAAVDWNGDARFDWLVNSRNADLFVQVDGPSGSWSFHSQGTLAPTNIEGHDVSPAAVDFDGDGIPDFLGGAEDGRFYYLHRNRTKLP